MTLPAPLLARLTAETEADLPCGCGGVFDPFSARYHAQFCPFRLRPVVLARRVADAERIEALETECRALNAMLDEEEDAGKIGTLEIRVAELEMIVRALSAGAQDSPPLSGRDKALISTYAHRIAGGVTIDLEGMEE